MDELIKAQEAGEPVMVEIDYLMTRVCAELFKIEGGVVFVDIGWNDQYGCPGHPIHIVRGEMSQGKDGRWIILEPMGDGTEREFVFRRIRKDKPAYLEWLAWEQAKHEQGQPYDREVIKRAVDDQLLDY